MIDVGTTTKNLWKLSPTVNKVQDPLLMFLKISTACLTDYYLEPRSQVAPWFRKTFLTSNKANQNNLRAVFLRPVTRYFTNPDLNLTFCGPESRLTQIPHFSKCGSRLIQHYILQLTNNYIFILKQYQVKMHINNLTYNILS